MKFKLKFSSSIGGVFYSARVWHDAPPGLAKDPLFVKLQRSGKIETDDKLPKKAETASVEPAKETATMPKPAAKKRSSLKKG